MESAKSAQQLEEDTDGANQLEAASLGPLKEALHLWHRDAPSPASRGWTGDGSYRDGGACIVRFHVAMVSLTEETAAAP